MVQDRHLRYLAVMLRFCFERSLHIDGEPLLLFHSNIAERVKKAVTASKKPDEAYFTLTAMGLPGSYGEALVVSCATHIFQLLQSKQHRVRINSMGTTEDAKKYFAKLSKTLRKAQKYIHTDCQKLLEQNLLVEAHTLLHDSRHAGVAECITQTLRLLSDSARQHFEQAIEYLEAHDLHYELAPDLVELPHVGTHTVFEILSPETPLRARGGRYDTLPYYLYRRKIPVVSMTMTLPDAVVDAQPLQAPKTNPRAFFLHAGEKARRRSLYVLSKLCNADVPVAHRLHCTKVFDQLTDQTRQLPYTIIFGQEEAESNILRVRKNDTRASNIVHITDEALSTIKSLLRT